MPCIIMNWQNNVAKAMHFGLFLCPRKKVWMMIIGWIIKFIIIYLIMFFTFQCPFGIYSVTYCLKGINPLEWTRDCWMASSTGSLPRRDLHYHHNHVYVYSSLNPPMVGWAHLSPKMRGKTHFQYTYPILLCMVKWPDYGTLLYGKRFKCVF